MKLIYLFTKINKRQKTKIDPIIIKEGKRSKWNIYGILN